MKRKHLLFKEAVCKNRISLIKLFVNRNLHTIEMYTQHNNVHIWARGPAKPPCRLFNIYAHMYKYQVLYKHKNRSTKAGHENPKKPAGG